MDEQAAVDRTRAWIASIVVGLNLCPFAERVLNGDMIRYVVTDAADAGAVAAVLTNELQFLASEDRGKIETTLVIHPRALVEFEAYNDFLNIADELIAHFGLRGVIQLASFHPQYQFVGTDRDAVENYTNRSPYPMLHLLREESISLVATGPKALLDIPRRNVEALRRLGIDNMMGRLKAIGWDQSI